MSSLAISLTTVGGRPRRRRFLRHGERRQDTADRAGASAVKRLRTGVNRLDQRRGVERSYWLSIEVRGFDAARLGWQKRTAHGQ